MDQLNAYEGNYEPLHYTMKFIDGLKPEFKSAMLMQRPSTLDTTFVLARLQEEVAPPFKKKDYGRSDYGFHQKPPFKSPLPLPAPPGKQTKSHIFQDDDQRSQVASRAKSSEDRWRALRNLRRAKGLCQFCAEKWSKDHKCADTVQLHALQEMLELFQVDDPAGSVDGTPDWDEGQMFMTLSLAAVTDPPIPRTMCLTGKI